jgi:hypothetical protein
VVADDWREMLKGFFCSFEQWLISLGDFYATSVNG